MEDITCKFGRLGIEIPEILLPQGVDLQKWALIACDQFTQDRNYWEKAQECVSGSPSTLNLIFPEVFLADEGRTERIGNIHRAMGDYLREGIFAAGRRGFVYLERDTPHQRGRRGLVAAIDLERYDWAQTARPLIRATEGTVPERLPPRMDIRRGAPLETPHILLLIDDDTDTLLAGLGECAKKTAPTYQTKLMMDSGSISGWFLESEHDWAFLAEGLEKLARSSVSRYAAGNETPFLFAVGDGNHSLAAAKGIWEEYKKAHGSGGLSGGPLGGASSSGASPGGILSHPCRYALVEIENIYDPAITFEPIHRVVFGMEFDECLNLLSRLPGFSSRTVADRAELVRLTAEPGAGNRFGIISGGISGGRYALIETSEKGIATASLQPLLDGYLETAAHSSIDYIHGEDELFRLAGETGQPLTAILLPSVQKAGLFETIARSGPLPRKSFSMGEACEKRFYLECRKLFADNKA